MDVHGEVSLAKTLGDPFQLFDTSQFTEMMRTNNRVLIGHNRFATTGKVTRRNAHPFELDTLVGVHNGTLTNKWQLKNGSKYDVDSEALYHDIEEDGAEKAINRTKGAWALVWWDKEDKTLNFLRNKERPLHYCYSEDKKVIFWASEAWMLTAILGREQYKHDKVVEFNEDMHYSFNIQLAVYNEMKEIEKPKGKLIEGYKEVAVGHQGPKGWSKVRNLHPSNNSLPDGTKDYLGKRDLVFNAKNICTDKHGQEYMKLQDSSRPALDIRLYFNKSAYLRGCAGKQLRGDIMSMGYENAKEYFKVSPWRAEVVGTIPKDPHGNELNEEAFLKKYHSCSWCSAPISYMDDCHIFDMDGGVLCKDCCLEPEVAKYVKM